MSKLEKGASYPELEIIAKLATVLEVEPAELPRLRPGKDHRRGGGLEKSLRGFPPISPP
jgi:hypothetical protein